MPTYDYKCPTCDHRFDAFQSMTEPPVTVCPHCGCDGVERLISPGAGLIFKGSGFYITDYRKDSYTQDAKKESPGSPKPKPEPAPKPDTPAPSVKPAKTDTPKD